MQTTNLTSNSEGFTLVELSIVLVIIGLLIGGILVAQSMIGTSKIVSVAAQIGQFDAGVMNFKTKYNYLPGDAPTFGGDGDGIIDRMASGGDNDATNLFGCELANFWNSWDPTQYTGFACGSNTSIKATITGSAKNVPASKLGSPGSFFIASVIATNADGYHATTTDRRNFYYIMSGSQLQNFSSYGSFYQPATTTSSNSALTPSDLLALDKKLDDGVGNTGNIISGAIRPQISAPLVGGVGLTALSTCSNVSGVYQVQNPGYECTPLVRIGAQTGDPQ